MIPVGTDTAPRFTSAPPPAAGGRYAQVAEPCPVPGAPSDLLTVRGLEAEWPGLAPRWIRGVVDRRAVALFKVGNRILVSRAEFAAFLASGRVEPQH